MSSTIYADASWRVTHLGDVGADGRADILWRNAATGQTAIWTMNGTTTVSSAIVFADPQWSVVVADQAP